MEGITQNSTSSNKISNFCLDTNDFEILKTSGIISNKWVIVVYFIWYPLICGLGIFGNLFSIIVLRKQFEFERIYYSQLLIMINDFIQCLFSLIFGIINPFLFNATRGPNWIKYNYSLSKYGSMQVVFLNIIATNLMVLIVASNLDRLQV